MKKVSVRHAAERLGVSIAAVRGGLEQGSLPIGFFVKHEKRTAYYIYEHLLERFVETGGAE